MGKKTQKYGCGEDNNSLHKVNDSSVFDHLEMLNVFEYIKIIKSCGERE